MMVFITLAAAAATVGALHALAPDHWLPIAAVSRARAWSIGRTARVAFLCGAGHVTVSAVLGLLALGIGARVVSSFGAQIASVAGVLMIGFGVAYALWGLRKLAHHAHAHAGDPSRTSTWALFAIYSADACVALIPVLFAAATLPIIGILGIILIYEAATIGTMVGLAVASRAGASMLPGHWFEHYGDAAAGGMIAVTGIAVALLGI